MLPVISASKRTDVPAFYLHWLIERLDAGYVDVPNPFFRGSDRVPVSRVSLRPEEVGWLILWSKNYAPFLRRQARFDAYILYFQFTLNPANERLEPGLPVESARFQQVEALAARYGGERIAWRYDPLTFWQEGGAVHSNYDLDFFARACAVIGPLGVRRCFISLAEPYREFRRRVAVHYPGMRLEQPPEERVQEMGRELQAIAAAQGIELLSCAEPSFDTAGIARGACVDGELLNRLAALAAAPLGGAPAKVSLAVASDRSVTARSACLCTRMVDIGSYQQRCGYACLYCYANPAPLRPALIARTPEAQ